jgi:hypothetical protein
MKKSSRIIWIGLLIVILGAILYLYLDQPSRYNWVERYQAEGGQPYDIRLFTNLLRNNQRKAEFVMLNKGLKHELAQLDESVSYNLIVVKRNYNPDTAEVMSLMKFVESGNTLFISANYITPLLSMAYLYGTDSMTRLYNHATSSDFYAIDLPDSLYELEKELGWEKTDSLLIAYQNALAEKAYRVAFTDSFSYSYHISLRSDQSNDRLILKYVIHGDSSQYNWRRVNLFKNAEAEVINTMGNDSVASYARFKYGKGQILISSTPLLFSNFYLRQEKYFHFAGKMVNQLSADKILLDNTIRPNNDIFSNQAKIGKSPLSFILGQPALKWAWYTLIITALIFVIFESKRKQRVIPITRPNLNTTLAYARTLGSLQLKEKNNASKAAEIYSWFLNQVRSGKRMHGMSAPEMKDRIVQRLPEYIRETQIVFYIGEKSLRNQEVRDEEVVQLFNYIQLIINEI